MGHFAYLFNSNVPSNDVPKVQGEPHISIEGPRWAYPLPWICCFRTDDLAPFTLTFECGSKHDLLVPVASIENAVRNLDASFPRYERLVGDTRVAREYWMQAVEAIKELPFRYVTLDISDFIYSGTENGSNFARGFSTVADPLSGSDDLFEYYTNVQPRSLSEFTGSATVQNKQANHNSCVLYCPEYVAPLFDYASAHFMRSKELAEKGVAGGMFNLGLCYFHGRGVAQDVQEGIRWCIKAYEAGWESADVFLCAAYRSGPYGIGIDKEKAAFWEEKLNHRTKRFDA